MTTQVITLSPAPQGNDSAGIVNYASGQIAGDGGTPAAYTLPIGFAPRYVLLLCIASSVAANVGRSFEWFDGMADGNALETTLATGSGSAASKAITTTLGPTVLGSNPLSNPLRSVTWPAGVFDPTATYVYQIEG
jgi:hypothetical protein